MLLLIETWSAACCWFSASTNCSMVVRIRKPLLDPGERQRERWALSLQGARELGHEGAYHRRIRARHVGDDEDQALRDPSLRSPSSGPPRFSA